MSTIDQNRDPQGQLKRNDAVRLGQLPGEQGGLADRLNKVDEALALWKKIQEKYPSPSAATVGLATTYAERKEYGKATPYFEELVKADPENAEFKKGLEEARKGAKK